MGMLDGSRFGCGWRREGLGFDGRAERREGRREKVRVVAEKDHVLGFCARSFIASFLRRKGLIKALVIETA